MKFRVGDKVKYDSGDWWFYGTISAVIENSISPCYRVSVDRMEKKNCKFSITQFEFELALDKDEESDKEQQRWEKSELDYLKQIQEAAKKVEIAKEVRQEVRQEVEQVEKEEKVAKVEKAEKLPKRRTAGAWERNLEQFQKGERSNTIYTWMTQNRRLFKTNKLSKEKTDKLKAIDFPFESSKKRGRVAKPKQIEPIVSIKPTEQPKPSIQKKEVLKRTKAGAWEKNLELYKSGDKSNVVYAWIARNRKLFSIDKLPNDQLIKLNAINFPFETPPRKRQLDSWDKQLQLWKNGNRNPSLQLWREKSVKRFVSGKLSNDRIEKLKEIGILK